MLRIFVISLVVANLLLLGFQSSKPTAPVQPRASRAAVVDADIPTIHLFSEMLDDQGLIDGNRRCFSLGPFHSAEDRDAMYNRLLEVAEEVNERQTQALVEKGYWVFMPPYESLLDANQALLALQALGLQDIGVIYSGEWENAVSLGYFLRQENAVRRKQDLEERGYTPMMRVQRQSEPRYWLDYEQKPGAGLIALDMQDRPNDFSSRATPCPEQEPAGSDSTVAQGETAQVILPAQEEETLPGQETDAERGDAGEGLPDAVSENPSSEAAETANGSGEQAAQLVEEQVEAEVMQTTGLEAATGTGSEEPVDAGVASGAGAEEPVDAEVASGDGAEEAVDAGVEGGDGAEEAVDPGVASGDGAEEAVDAGVASGDGAEEAVGAGVASGDSVEEPVDPEAESSDGVEEPADPDVEPPPDEVTVPE